MARGRLVVEYAHQLANGQWQYRRRVPKDVAEAIGRREFKKALGDGRKAAQAVYDAFHRDVEAQLRSARARLKLEALAASGTLTERQTYEVAVERAKAMLGGAEAGSEARGDLGLGSIAASLILDAYPHDPETGEPVGVSALDGLTAQVLAGRSPAKKPAPTLQDAFRLYVADRLGGEENTKERPAIQRAHRARRLALEALGRDPALSALTRQDAKAVRDHLSHRSKTTGERVATETVQRELNTIRAVVNFAIREFDLSGNVGNPFENLPAGGSGKGNAAIRESDRRDALPQNLAAAMREKLETSSKTDPTLALIWRILDGTGARLGEVAGLMVDDVKLADEIPHIVIRHNEVRRLKNGSTARSVPLLGDAKEAAKAAVARAGSATFLFPKYGKPRGADVASAALMKHLRAITDDRKHTNHSLRHSMKDWLILSGASQQEQDMLLGHAAETVGDRVYGGARTRLVAAAKALERALAERDTRAGKGDPE